MGRHIYAQLATHKAQDERSRGLLVRDCQDILIQLGGQTSVTRLMECLGASWRGGIRPKSGRFWTGMCTARLFAVLLVSMGFTLVDQGRQGRRNVLARSDLG